jgi:hypothetical protein
VGDLNFSGTVTASDIAVLQSVIQSNGGQFNPAGDVQGDGNVDIADALLVGPVLAAKGVDPQTWDAHRALINSDYVRNGVYTVAGTHTVFDVTAGTTVVTDGSKLNARNVRGNVLSVGRGAAVVIGANGTAAGTSRVSSLSMAGMPGKWEGKIDLADNVLVVDYTGESPLAMVRDMVAGGYAGGRWDGNGIMTSSAAGTAATALAYADTASLPIGTLGGMGVDATAVVVKYTYVGDANLDGRVDGLDYARLAPGAGDWDHGDFNYDGLVNADDFSLFSLGAALQGAPLVQVPEPSSVHAAVAAVALLICRRRRGERAWLRHGTRRRSRPRTTTRPLPHHRRKVVL